MPGEVRGAGSQRDVHPGVVPGKRRPRARVLRVVEVAGTHPVGAVDDPGDGPAAVGCRIDWVRRVGRRVSRSKCQPLETISQLITVRPDPVNNEQG